MVFGKKKSWEDQYDEDYAARAERRDRVRGSTLWIHLTGFVVTIAVVTGLTGLMFGQHTFEKTLTALVCPTGIVWLLLMFQTYFSLIYQRIWMAIPAMVCWLILTVFGNGVVSNSLVLQLEKPFLNMKIQELPELEFLFLLGGGTTTNVNGEAQVSSAGDRVVMAARMFHRGQANQIVCTGQQLFKTSPDDLEPNQEAAEVLQELGVPKESVAMIRGVNTFEETKLIAEFLRQQQRTDAKIGIVTSGWHLNRAKRLAVAAGLDPVMVPADFRSSHFSNGPRIVIPSSDALQDSARCIKELLAALVGR